MSKIAKKHYNNPTSHNEHLVNTAIECSKFNMKAKEKNRTSLSAQPKHYLTSFLN